MKFLAGLVGFLVFLYIAYYLFSTVLSAAGTLCLIASAALFLLKKRGRVISSSKAQIALLVFGAILLPAGIKHRLNVDDMESQQAAKEAKFNQEKSAVLDSLIKSRCGDYPYVPKEILNVAHATQDYNNSVGAYTNSADHLDDAIAERKQQYSKCEDRVRKENN
ncbi:hypothetical protein NE850_29320 [Paraburkholderia sp. USG1]|uniref:hypothetical protein n=1 Tax=Paraburkholderia sp. USG1 TaxID=2952268 RepID=UPI002859E518|nr:hypothetical protein [Paraburkholderia sp. USG1]MDR8400417.1 hypothetical protein [Paraburkholderia sp. USG1]